MCVFEEGSVKLHCVGMVMVVEMKEGTAFLSCNADVSLNAAFFFLLRLLTASFEATEDILHLFSQAPYGRVN